MAENEPTDVRTWRAQEEDLDGVAQLISEFRDHLGGSGPPEIDELRQNAARILGGGDGEYLLGAVGEGEPAGVVQLRFRWCIWTSAEDCWLEDLFVRESTRRTGLGRALVNASFDRARERGCKRIELDTNAGNDAAIALYESSGFSLAPKPPGDSLFLGRKL